MTKLEEIEELDTVKIGERIRNIRMFQCNGESRGDFGDRCGLTENHVGQLERGDILIGLPTLNKIKLITGVSSDYILFGEEESSNISAVRRNINAILDMSNKEELKHFYRFLTSFKSYMSKL